MTPYLGLAVVLLVLVLGFTIVGVFVQSRRIGDLEGRLLRLTRGSDGGNLQDVLEEHLDTVARVVGDVDELGERAARLEVRTERAFQRIGLVRFNPFEDTGSNQSFALALLDGRDDGIVISSLHTRSATRIYAKTLAGGRADAALSAEETEAVEVARTGARQARDGAGDAPADGRASPGLGERGGLARERPSV